MSKDYKQNLDLWVEEKHRGVVSMRFRVEKVLFSEKSPYQQVDIVETSGLGRMLLNDGLVMTSERDEFVYHEMIAHVPLFVHPNPKNVLVIGGGDGGTVREILKHPSVEKCQLVEIDELVVKACQEFLPQTASCLTDSRAEVLIKDGVQFVKDTSLKYDVIIVDSTDPIGPATPLFGEEFYSDLSKILNEKGIIVSQAESPFYEMETQKSILKILSERFEKTHIYNFSNLTYPGGLWSFSFASNSLCPLSDFDPTRVKDSGFDLHYYDENIHNACFQLPKFMKDSLGNYLTPLG